MISFPENPPSAGNGRTQRPALPPEGVPLFTKTIRKGIFSNENSKKSTCHLCASEQAGEQFSRDSPRNLHRAIPRVWHRSPYGSCWAQPTFLAGSSPSEVAAMLPLDFGMKTRGKVLKLIGKRCRSSGR